MNQDGDIREISEDEPLRTNEISISSKTVSALRLLSHKQRQRFYTSFKHNNSEQEALNVARSCQRR